MAWEIETRPNWYCIYDEIGWYVAGCQSERQAQLIANAPRMLEALEEIVDLPTDDLWRCYGIALAAIAAVKGEGDETELV